jgi:epoxyqueuosine reductase
MERSSGELKAYCLSIGFQSVGVTSAIPSKTVDAYGAWLGAGFHGEMDYLEEHVNLKKDPDALLPGAKTVIAVALNYNQPNPAASGQPRIARYALGRDYHKVVRSKLRRLQRWMSAEYPEAEFRICVDSAPLAEREYANLAGLGWYGKNTCLIDSKRGSWFVLGFLLTTLAFEADPPAQGGCGTCTKCIDACPTGAIVRLDGRWVIDSRRCISYLTIEKHGEFSSAESKMIGEWTFGCDICQEVCPFNEPRTSQPQRATHTAEPDFLQSKHWPSLVDLAQISEPNWDSLTKGSPVRRAGPAGLRRNARANVENSKLGRL